MATKEINSITIQTNERTRRNRLVSLLALNPVDSIPEIIIEDEYVFSDGTTSPVQRDESLVIKYDPSASIALINPETGELTGGTISHAELFAVFL